VVLEFQLLQFDPVFSTPYVLPVVGKTLARHLASFAKSVTHLISRFMRLWR
jgi:hypothetical protein